MAQPIAVMVRRYRCPFCPHSRASKQASAAHIGRCWDNPDVRSCRTCQNFEPGDWPEPEVGYPGSDPTCAAGLDPQAALPLEVVHCPSWEAREPADVPTNQPERSTS